MTDSPLAVRFVAAPDNWSRSATAIRGIVVHMAEGGGTVSWLTRNDGNSSHYVVEYDGDIVQMVLEARAAGSINPGALRTGDDAAYVYLGESVRYGRTAGTKVLGALYANPNAAVIAIEVEGFAATGPNSVQRAALARLVADIRRRRGKLGVLGHRDFQSYKACPGHRVPWIDYGGHTAVAVATAPAPAPSPVPQEEVMKGFTVPEQPTKVTLKPQTVGGTKSRWLYVDSTLAANPSNRQLEPIRELWLVGFVSADVYIVAYEPTTADANQTSQAMYVRSIDVASTRVVVPTTDTTPYSKEQLDASRLAGRKEGADLVRDAAQAKAVELGAPTS